MEYTETDYARETIQESYIHTLRIRMAAQETSSPEKIDHPEMLLFSPHWHLLPTRWLHFVTCQLNKVSLIYDNHTVPHGTTPLPGHFSPAAGTLAFLKHVATTFFTPRRCARFSQFGHVRKHIVERPESSACHIWGAAMFGRAEYLRIAVILMPVLTSHWARCIEVPVGENFSTIFDRWIRLTKERESSLQLTLRP